WFWLIAQPPLLSTLRLTPSQIVLGGTSTAMIILSGIAPAGGAVISLTSSNPNVASVPANVTIPAGSTSATLAITGRAPGQTTITATLASVSRTAPLTVVPPPPTLTALTPSQFQIFIGGTATVTVALSGIAPAGGIVVSLSSSNPAVAPVPANVT